MNKLKLFYDVVKKLKEKDFLQGVGMVEVQKDQEKVFYIKNEFQKDLVKMETKTNVTSEINYEGKQVKHQSTTEFTNHCFGHGKHHSFFKRGHHAGGQCVGIKAKLTKLAFGLQLLNQIKAEEQADKTILVTLEMTELPEDIKMLIQEKMNRTEGSHKQHSCCFAKELCCVEKGNFSLAISINKDYDINKIVITFDGVQNNEDESQHTLNIIAELQLT